MNYIDDLTTCSDAELIVHLRSGDKRALTVIFDRHAWTLDSYISRLIPWRRKMLFRDDNCDFVQEVLIEVFERLWEGHEKLTIQADLPKYLNKVAVQALLISTNAKIT